jgi:ABC-type branched-subunit amino acid transport system permease subunit
MTAMSFYLWCVALGAALLAMMSWTVELLLRRSIGVYLSYASIAIVACLAAYLAYADRTRCTAGFLPQDCEWGGPMTALLAFVTALTIPALLLSTVVLKKWSDNRSRR